MLDVNFIILAKKLRPGSGSSVRATPSLFFCVRDVCRTSIFSFRIFFAVIIFSSFAYTRTSLDFFLRACNILCILLFAIAHLLFFLFFHKI